MDAINSLQDAINQIKQLDVNVIIQSADTAINQLNTQYNNFKFTTQFDFTTPSWISDRMIKVSDYHNYSSCTNSLFIHDSWIPSTDINSSTISIVPCQANPYNMPSNTSCVPSMGTNCYGCLDSSQIFISYGYVSFPTGDLQARYNTPINPTCQMWIDDMD
jgi:hypothetical protein